MTRQRSGICTDSDVDPDALVSFSKLILGIKYHRPGLRKKALRELRGYGFTVGYNPSWERRRSRRGPGAEV